MKIDRRNFLSLGAGATAGLAFSPLPWKLMDDSSIWTQNWPWVPVPTDGEASYVDTVCSLCPGGCGITIRKIDDRVVKAEKKEGDNANSGICILGLSAPQLLYSPSRIKTPLKKIENKWVKISVKEAVAEIAEKLKDLKKDRLSHTLACISGSSSGTVPALFERFLKAYGSPNFITVPSVKDIYKLVFSLSLGSPYVPAFDIANSDFVVSFGTGLLDGWGNPAQSFKAHSVLKDNKKKLIQIEARLSNTAAKADKWMPIKPGTEGVLALGMANIIIEKRLYFNKNILFDSVTEGFEEFKALLSKDYSVKAVAEITGVKQEDITALAEDFMKAQSPLALFGRSEGAIPGSLHEMMAINFLNALASNFNKAGGVYLLSDNSYINWSEPILDASAQYGLNKKRLDGAGEGQYFLAKHLLNRLPEVVNSSETSPINMLFVTDSNPFYTMADTKLVRKAFEKIPFIVSFSSYMDETASMADIILPNHFFLERYQDVSATCGLKPAVGLSKPVVNPIFDTIHSGDAIISIGKALGGTIAASFAWDDYKACLDQTLEAKKEVMDKDLFWIDESGIFNAFAANVENMESSGKFEFINDKIRQTKPYAFVDAEGEKKKYPLTLIRFDTMRIASGYTANSPFMTKTVADTVIKENDIFVEINPKTAAEYNLTDGSKALLTTPKGKAQVRVHLYEGIMPGIISMPSGLGHSGYDNYLAGKGVNINELIGQIEDPASGFDAAWGIRAVLARV
jgi:anaerobic selenocysteine-containing dehydrogenase